MSNQQSFSDAMLTEIAGVLADLATLQVRVSKLFKTAAGERIISPPAEETSRDPQSPSDRDVSAGDKACQADVAEGNRPSSFQDGELQRHEGHIAEGAGADEAAAGERPSDPAPNPLSQRERILNCYETSTITPTEIGIRLGIKRSTVSAYLSMGRTGGDARVKRGDLARGKVPNEEAAFAAAVVETVREGGPAIRTYPIHNEPPPRFRLPSVPRSGTAPLRPIEEITAPRGKLTLDIGEAIMVVDEENLRVSGPFGDLQVSRPFALNLARMKGGGVYDIKTLRDVGNWPTETAVKDHFAAMRAPLSRIGVELVTVNKFMFRLRRLGR